MFNISSILSSLNEKDQTSFNAARASMQKTYMQCVSIFGGVSALDQTDSWWMDAMDQRLAQLMARSGRDVPVVLPTSQAVAETLPPKSVEALTKTDPTDPNAGRLPQSGEEQKMADLMKATLARAAGATPPVNGTQDPPQT